MTNDSVPIETEAGEAVIEEEVAEQPSLEAQLAAANARADENYSKFLLTVADFDNYKKRLQRDMDSIVLTRHRMLLERFLPVLDNLERALDSKAGGEKLRDGLEQTLRGFEALLASEGVKAIDVKGKPFDPRVAEAIATRDADGEPDDTVVDVAEKGYSLGEELLRPAKVIVAKHSAE
jgi:molecular chaperone GrpE